MGYNEERVTEELSRVYVRHVEKSSLDDGTMLEYVTYERQANSVPTWDLHTAPLISVPRVVWLSSCGTSTLLALVYWMV